MTVEATSRPGPAAEERLRSRALEVLKTRTLEAILGSRGPLRTMDGARIVADSLGMRLSEEEGGGLASVVRMVLDSDPLYSQANRQWDLALRMGRAEGDRRKPVERAVEDFIDLLGAPTKAHPVAVLVAAVYGRPVDYFEKMIERLVDTRPQFFRVGRDRIGIRRWLLHLSSDDPEDVEDDNFGDGGSRESLESLRAVTRGMEAADPLSYTKTVIARSGGPVDNRALQFLTWCVFPETDPAALFGALAGERSLFLERGPTWVSAAGHRQVLEAIRALAREPQMASDLLAASVPSAEEEIGILAPLTVRVSDEDLDQVYEFMSREARSCRLTDLLQQVLEAFPGSRTYAAVQESLSSRLREDPRFRWVGFERFRLEGTIPAEVEVLPEGLAFDEREYLGPEGEEIDKLLDPRDWKFNLDEQVAHCLVQDVGDDATQPPASTPTRLETSPPLHYYVAGTRYLRNADRGFFPPAPDIVQVTLLAADGGRFEAWINNRLGLLYGLKEWYDANLPWVGGRFAIERTEQPDEYRLVYNGEVEPLMEISVNRLQQLLTLRGEAASEGLPLTEIATRILKGYPEGLHFVTLFTEVNVVRRVRRAQVASVLSAQRFLIQTPQAPGIWRFDEKRATKARKKGGPKRPLREVYTEEEEELEE